MAQMDMNKLKAGVQNSAKSEELKTDEQAKAPHESGELTNNVTEDQKDINEVASETKETTAIVCYIGNGIWKDSKHELWADTDKIANILRERKYNIDEYKEREDLKFMVNYGAMRVTFV